MMNLPPKPAAVAHVSDKHWEAALDRANRHWRTIGSIEDIINHARCLILLGEVAEPIDPIDRACDRVFSAYFRTQGQFNSDCRKHFAGLTFPAVQS